MARIRLWAVLGEASVGKSTTVGHLGGEFGKGENGLRRGRGGGVKEIPLRSDGYLQILSRRQSLQEAGKTPEQVAKEIENASARLNQQNPTIESAFFNVLLAIRTDSPRKMKKGEDYLSYFVKRGWLIESLAILSPKSRDEHIYRRFGAPTCYIEYSSGLDIIQMVGQVRNHFG
jgi:hypothetical protein